MMKYPHLYSWRLGGLQSWRLGGLQSWKLKTENQFWNPGFTNGIRQICGYQCFCCVILFYLVCLYSPYFSISYIKSTHMLKPLKGKLGVSFNDDLSNFGLRAQNLRQSIVIKISFETRVFTNGVRQFCRYQYLCYEILYHLVSSYFLFPNLLN